MRFIMLPETRRVKCVVDRLIRPRLTLAKLMGVIAYLAFGLWLITDSDRPYRVELARLRAASALDHRVELAKLRGNAGLPYDSSRPGATSEAVERALYADIIATRVRSTKKAREEARRMAILSVTSMMLPLAGCLWFPRGLSLFRSVRLQPSATAEPERT